MQGVLRRLRFRFLERVALPVLAPLLRGWIGSWRVEGPSSQDLALLMARPRAVVVTFHGLLAPLLAFRGLAGPEGRRFVVMLSPSLDGQLLAAMLARLGIDHVVAAPGSRGVAGSLEFVDRVRGGDIGVIAADGPLGPRFVVKPGALRLAAAADAHLGLMVAQARASLPLGSWDGARLPLPFARVTGRLSLVPPPAGVDPALVAQVQEELLRGARGLP